MDSTKKNGRSGIRRKPGVIAVLLVVIFIAGIWYIKSLKAMRRIDPRPSTEDGEYRIEYPEIGADQDLIQQDDRLFIPLEKVNQLYAEQALFYDALSGKVYYTTEKHHSIYTVDQPGVVVDNMKQEDRVRFISENGTIYMDLNMACTYFQIPNSESKDQKTVILYPRTWQTGKIAETKDTVYLKQYPKEGSLLESLRGHKEGYEYLCTLDAGTEVRILGENNGYYRVSIPEGLIGYVEEVYLEETGTETKERNRETVELPEERQWDHPVVLSWYQDFTGVFNDSVRELYADAEGIVDVISPTWFKFDENGNLISLENADMVQWAHKRGYQVWVLVDNDFDDAHTYEVLKDEEKRTNLVSELKNRCKSLGVDGINVDFESLSEQTAPYFLQFVRELSQALRPAGYSVSVDVTVPMNWSYYYHRDLLAQCSDYLVVMGYDEHYSGCGEAGSVGSRDFITKGVAALKAMNIPAEKILLGIPFYTQLWITENGATTNQAYGMDAAENFARDHKMEISYDAASGQNYGKVKEKKTVYEFWFEDETSLDMRLSLAEKETLGGIACWKMGMEKKDVWPLVEAYKEK